MNHSDLLAVKGTLAKVDKTLATMREHDALMRQNDEDFAVVKVQHEALIVSGLFDEAKELLDAYVVRRDAMFARINAELDALA